LAASRRARDEDQAPLERRKLRDARRQAELVQRRDRGGQQPQREREPTALVVERAAESGEPRDLEREVTVLPLLQLGDSPLAQECVREPNNRVGPRRRQLFYRGQRRRHTQAWRPVHSEQNVGRAAPQRERQELDDLGRKLLWPDDTERRELGARNALCVAHERITLADFTDRRSSEFQSRGHKNFGVGGAMIVSRTCEHREFPRRSTRRRLADGSAWWLLYNRTRASERRPTKFSERKGRQRNAEASETQGGKRGRIHVDGTARRRLDRRGPGGRGRPPLSGLCPRRAARRGKGAGGQRPDGGAGLRPAELGVDRCSGERKRNGELHPRADRPEDRRRSRDGQHARRQMERRHRGGR